MTLTNIPIDLQNLLLLNYELQVKTIIMVGWWALALVYVLFWYKRQQPTKYFLVGTVRAVIYVTSYIWCWAFWVLYPVTLHPNVPIDQILIFLGYSYAIISTVFLVIFVFNFTLWIPRAIVRFGKLDIGGWEDNAIRHYFGDKTLFTKWYKK